jgi:hypothetical protein
MSAIVQRDTAGKWLPGTSGNPVGRRAEGGELKLVRELAREHTAEAVEALREIMLDGGAQPMARVRAAEALLARGWGQPSPEVDLEVANALNDGPIAFKFAMSEKALEIQARQR